MTMLPTAPAPVPADAARWPRADRMPPLGWKGHAWRIAVTTLLSFALLLVVFADLPDPDGLPDGLAALFLLDMSVLGPFAIGLLLLHRRYPLSVATATTLLSFVSAAAAVPALVCLLSVSTRRRAREIVPLAGLSVLAGVVFEGIYPEKNPIETWVFVPVMLVLTAAVVAWGLFLGTRRELVESWRLRADAADREQAVAAERAREAERTRIAREMHDVLAHRLSLVSMHAGVLAFRADLAPDQVRAEARVIAEASRQALDELRGVLGVLRDSDAGRPPQPSIADLADLVAQARTVGPVELENRLGEAPPAPLGRHVYRVVQEGLTNARKHAPGAPVTVRVDGRPGGDLVVEVRNPAPATASAAAPVGAGRAAGSGLGLVGLTERASLAGGRIESGRTPDGGFALRVLLPWPTVDGDD